MTLRQHFANAITDLSRNKLRTGLSMLGIIIWVFSVIVLLSVWNWATEEIVWEINSMWTNIISIMPGSSFISAANGSRWAYAKLDDKTMSFLKTNVSNIAWMAPILEWHKLVSYWETTLSNAWIVWTTPEYFVIRTSKLMKWSFFTENDEKNMSKVVVLWESVSDDLFEDQEPIWKKIKIWNDMFTVIGVVEEDMAVSRWVYIPLSTAKVRTVWWSQGYTVIFLSVKNWDLIDATKNEIEEWLRKFYWIKEWNKSNFNVTTQKDFLEIVDKIMWVMSTFLASIAAISLLVWWIWVMNIMLVSVTERTKEIWIRKAIWAKKSDIVSQFLAESVLMTVIWWIIGILLSILVVRIVNHVQDSIHAVITVKSVLIAVISSISIWLLFGIMPARNAAKLKPIDALRFE